MSKIAKLEQRIATAVARARALGTELVARAHWGVEYRKEAGWVPVPDIEGNKTVCICGAIAVGENPPNGKGILPAIAKKYGITEGQAESLSDGFEGYRLDSDYGDKTWHRIGRKWRRRADRVEN